MRIVDYEKCEKYIKANSYHGEEREFSHEYYSNEIESDYKMHLKLLYGEKEYIGMKSKDLEQEKSRLENLAEMRFFLADYFLKKKSNANFDEFMKFVKDSSQNIGGLFNDGDLLIYDPLMRNMILGVLKDEDLAVYKEIINQFDNQLLNKKEAREKNELNDIINEHKNSLIFKIDHVISEFDIQVMKNQNINKAFANHYQNKINKLEKIKEYVNKFFEALINQKNDMVSVISSGLYDLLISGDDFGREILKDLDSIISIVYNMNMNKFLSSNNDLNSDVIINNEIVDDAVINKTGRNR